MGAKVTGVAFFAGSTFFAGTPALPLVGEALANPDVETADARRIKVEHFMFVLLRVCDCELYIMRKISVLTWPVSCGRVHADMRSAGHHQQSKIRQLTHFAGKNKTIFGMLILFRSVLFSSFV